MGWQLASTRSAPTSPTGSSPSSSRAVTTGRACFVGTEIVQTDPAWHDSLIFGEHFHGDNGAVIGAFHRPAGPV